MRITVREVTFLLWVQAAGSFQPFGMVRTNQPRPRLLRLDAAGPDTVPDLVKAYQKSKPSAEITADLPDPTTMTSTPDIPVVTPDAIPDVVTPSISSPAATTSTAKPVAAYVDNIINSAKAKTASTETVKPYVDNFLKSAKDKYATTAASVVESPRDPGTVPTLADFVKGGFQKSTVTETTAIGQGKVPTLAGYIQSAASGKVPSAVSEGQSLSESQLEVAKAKFGLLLDNTIGLFGGGEETKKEISGLISKTASGMGAPDGLDPNILSEKYVVGWGIAIVAILFAAGARRAGESDATAAIAESIASDSSTKVTSGTTEDILAILQKEVATIKAETADLRKKLDAAQEEVSLKDAELSKERQKYADAVLKLNGEIEVLRAELVTSGTSSVPSIETTTAPPPKTDKVKGATTAKKATTTAPTEGKAKKKGAVKKVRITKGATTAAKTGETASPVEDVPEIKPKAKKAKAKKKKVKTAAKAPVANAATLEWSGLSQSTLQRKTIKELQEYLSSKGITTTSGDGKPLKKALLVEAVQAL